MLVVGFKAQYDVWNPKGMKMQSSTKTVESEEPKQITV
jgi:hypothetical protein